MGIYKWKYIQLNLWKTAQLAIPWASPGVEVTRPVTRRDWKTLSRVPGSACGAGQSAAKNYWR